MFGIHTKSVLNASFLHNLCESKQQQNPKKGQHFVLVLVLPNKGESPL